MWRLTVKMRHLSGIVALANRKIWRYGGVNTLEFVFI